MRGAIPPLPQYAFIVWCSVKAQGQLYFMTTHPDKYLKAYALTRSVYQPFSVLESTCSKNIGNED